MKIFLNFCFQDSTAEEFVNLYPLLKSTRLGSSLTGQQELIQIAAEQAELDQEFDPLDSENNQTDRLVTCINLALPLFSVSYFKNKQLFMYDIYISF